jgi:hypothetical protein
MMLALSAQASTPALPLPKTVGAFLFKIVVDVMLSTMYSGFRNKETNHGD